MDMLKTGKKEKTSSVIGYYEKTHEIKSLIP